MFENIGPSSADEVEYRVNALGPDGRWEIAEWKPERLTIGPNPANPQTPSSDDPSRDYPLTNLQTRPSGPLHKDLAEFKVDVRWHDNARLDLRGFASFTFDREGKRKYPRPQTSLGD